MARLNCPSQSPLEGSRGGKQMIGRRAFGLVDTPLQVQVGSQHPTRRRALLYEGLHCVADYVGVGSFFKLPLDGD